MQRKHSLLLMAALAYMPALAGDDFGIWTEVGVQKDFSQKLSAEVGVEFRAEDKVRQPARWAISLGAAYKPVKYVTVSAAYVYLRDYSAQEVKTDYKEDDDGNLVLNDEGQPEFNGLNVDHGHWRTKHRFLADVTGKLPVGRFTFSLRERYQYTHYAATTLLRTRYRSVLPSSAIESGAYSGDYEAYGGYYFGTVKVVSRDKAAKNRHYLRSRLKVDYNIRHCPLTPFVACELSNDLCSSLHLDKTRYTIGTEWKIAKAHRLSFAYVYEDGADDDDLSNNHALSVSYKFKF